MGFPIVIYTCVGSCLTIQVKTVLNVALMGRLTPYASARIPQSWESIPKMHKHKNLNATINTVSNRGLQKGNRLAIMRNAVTGVDLF